MQVKVDDGPRSSPIKKKQKKLNEKKGKATTSRQPETKTASRAEAELRQMKNVVRVSYKAKLSLSNDMPGLYV